jgi:hypothetical protein
MHNNGSTTSDATATRPRRAAIAAKQGLPRGKPAPLRDRAPSTPRLPADLARLPCLLPVRRHARPVFSKYADPGCWSAEGRGLTAVFLLSSHRWHQVSGAPRDVPSPLREPASGAGRQPHHVHGGKDRPVKPLGLSLDLINGGLMDPFAGTSTPATFSSSPTTSTRGGSSASSTWMSCCFSGQWGP